MQPVGSAVFKLFDSDPDAVQHTAHKRRSRTRTRRPTPRRGKHRGADDRVFVEQESQDVQANRFRFRAVLALAALASGGGMTTGRGGRRRDDAARSRPGSPTTKA
jgi:hypothetical protein